MTHHPYYRKSKQSPTQTITYLTPPVTSETPAPNSNLVPNRNRNQTITIRSLNNLHTSILHQPHNHESGNSTRHHHPSIHSFLPSFPAGQSPPNLQTKNLNVPNTGPASSPLCHIFFPAERGCCTYRESTIQLATLRAAADYTILFSLPARNARCELRQREKKQGGLVDLSRSPTTTTTTPTTQRICGSGKRARRVRGRQTIQCELTL
jgi:hypothetical protein